MKASDSSPIGQFIAFFDANPDEELTQEMAMVKFDITARQFEHALRRLRDTGHLEYVRVIRRPGGWK